MHYSLCSCILPDRLSKGLEGGVDQLIEEHKVICLRSENLKIVFIECPLYSTTVYLLYMKACMFTDLDYDK